MKQSYITDSLEQHLFFARIMKEHAFFLKVGILPRMLAWSEKASVFCGSLKCS